MDGESVGDTEALVLNSTFLVKEVLLEAFPGKTIVPAVGNHDTWPYDSDPGPAFYSKLCALWEEFLTAGALANCSQNGYFYTLVGGLKIISVNSQHQSSDALDWVKSEVSASALSGQKVYLMTHIPPGPASCYMCSCSSGYSGGCWGPDQFTALRGIVEEFSDTIVAAFSGHTHSDEIRVFTRELDQEPLVPLYISNSLTPYNPSTNPGVRLFKYDLGTMEVADYEQHFMHLGEANRGGDGWDFYSARSRYGLGDDMSAAAWAEFAARLDQDDDLFQLYYLASNAFTEIKDSASVCSDEWSASVYSPLGNGGRCKSGYLCPILHMDGAGYEECIAERNSTSA